MLQLLPEACCQIGLPGRLLWYFYARSWLGGFWCGISLNVWAGSGSPKFTYLCLMIRESGLAVSVVLTLASGGCAEVLPLSRS